MILKNLGQVSGCGREQLVSPAQKDTHVEQGPVVLVLVQGPLRLPVLHDQVVLLALVGSLPVAIDGVQYGLTVDKRETKVLIEMF